MRRAGKRPKDYAGRCNRCKRLVERGKETKFNGVIYGSECLKLAIGAAESQSNDLRDILGA